MGQIEIIKKDDLSMKIEKTKTAKKTNQIIVVIKNKIYLYNKVEGFWKKEMESDCIYGKNGFSKNRIEGDRTTPIGSFEILYAFGTEEKPNTQLEYRKILKTSYFSYDTSKEEEYNKWIESKIKIEGEHLIDYPKQYHYAMVIGFNNNPIVVGKGSSIFLHVKGRKKYTEGCIAVDEDVMIYLFEKVRKGAYIIMVEDIKDID